MQLSGIYRTRRHCGNHGLGRCTVGAELQRGSCSEQRDFAGGKTGFSGDVLWYNAWKRYIKMAEEASDSPVVPGTIPLKHLTGYHFESAPNATLREQENFSDSEMIRGADDSENGSPKGEVDVFPRFLGDFGTLLGKRWRTWDEVLVFVPARVLTTRQRS